MQCWLLCCFLSPEDAVRMVLGFPYCPEGRVQTVVCTQVPVLAVLIPSQAVCTTSPLSPWATLQPSFYFAIPALCSLSFHLYNWCYVYPLPTI